MGSGFKFNFLINFLILLIQLIPILSSSQNSILLKSNFSVIKICDFGTACPNKTIMTQTQGKIIH